MPRGTSNQLVVFLHLLASSPTSNVSMTIMLSFSWLFFSFGAQIHWRWNCVIATILHGPQLRHSQRNCRNLIFRSPTRVPSSPVFDRQIYYHGILPWNTAMEYWQHPHLLLNHDNHQGHLSPSRTNQEIKRPSMRFKLLSILLLPLPSLIYTLRRGF